MAEAFVACERDLTVAFANRALDARGELVGRRLLESWPEASRAAIETALAGALSTGRTVRFECPHPLTGGRAEADAIPSGDYLHLVLRDAPSVGDAESDLRAMVDSLPQIAWAADAQRLPTYLNRKWYEYTGATADEPYDAAKVVHPDDLQALWAAAQTAEAAGQPLEAEARLRRFDGEYRWHLVRQEPRKGPSGETLGYFGSSTDVHGLRLAREALAASESRLHLALEAAALGTWEFDAATGVTLYSESVGPMFGRAREAFPLSFEELADYLHPEDREYVLGRAQALLERDEPYFVRCRVVGDDGVVRWLESRGALVRSADGRPESASGIVADVSEDRARIAALEATVRVGQALATELDPERIVQALCDASTAAVGAQFGAFFYAVPDSSGERFGLYVLSGAPSEAFASFPAVRTTPLFAPTFRGEGTVRSDDVERDPRFSGMPHGHLPVRSYLAVTVRARSGEVLGGLLFGHSERGRFTQEHELLVESFAAQAAIAHENAVLYGRVREAVEGLERKVHERTEELERANEQLQGFTYHVSHDLRGPLRAIVATSRLLQEDFDRVLPEEARSLLTRQAEAATKLGLLIDDLLRLSRLSWEQIERRAVDLTALAEEAAEEALAAHPATQVRVEVDRDLAAVADPRLLRLALVNLVENAVKYSPAGGTVRVGARPDGAFFVSDEGIGIEPQYLQKIFEPFQRLHGEREFRGTGIGLANVRQVMERHGGAVWAESEPGLGSTFLFTLPS